MPCTSALYSERLLVGYRYYDQHQLGPAYAFGHGLTYSSFKLSNLQLTPATTATPTSSAAASSAAASAAAAATTSASASTVLYSVSVMLANSP